MTMLLPYDTPAEPIGARDGLEAPDVRRCVVVGIGNPLMGDDGVGIHVVQELQGETALSGSGDHLIEIIDGGTLGYLLIDRIAGVDGLIVVDAANLRSPPGTVMVLQHQELSAFLDDNSSTSVHEAGLIDLLQMLKLSGEYPRFVALVGVQPSVIDWSVDLSPDIAGSIGQVKHEVRRLLQFWAEGSAHG